MTEESNKTPSSDAQKNDNASKHITVKNQFLSTIQLLKEKGIPALLSYCKKTVKGMDGFIHYIAMRDSGTDNEPLNIARGPIVFGVWVLIIVFGLFGIWATFAPLDSAAVARGTVVLDTNRKTIQHLEGGIIKELLVHEGDFVKKGQPLVRLSQTAAKARLDLVTGQLLAAKATESRLVAERDGLESIDFDGEILEAQKHGDLEKIINSQKNLFVSRQNSINGQIDILRQRIGQLNDEINGLEAQEESTRDQRALINEEVEVVQKLLEMGNANKPRLLALQRKAAELGGDQGEYQARIAKARQAVTETELEIANLRTRFINEVVTELKETQVQVADMEERRRAAKDVLDRIIITAPQSGIITDMKYHTNGGVIAPGGKIMDIIPQDDKLVIHARVSLQDRDVVHENLTARVRLTAYKIRQAPILEGTVTQISPDSFMDEATRESYYKARIIIAEDQLARLGEGVELQPGMPADVLIVTGTRTFMSYLISPITDSMHKAFKEQ